MKGYRPKSAAAAPIRSEMLDELDTGAGAGAGVEDEGEVLRDGCGAGRRSSQKGETPGCGGPEPRYETLTPQLFAIFFFFF